MTEYRCSKCGEVFELPSHLPPPMVMWCDSCLESNASSWTPPWGG